MTDLRTLRRLIPALVLGVSTTIGFAGCGETSETKSTTTQSTPQGTTTEETTNKVKQSGDAPPPPAGTPSTPDATPPK